MTEPFVTRSTVAPMQITVFCSSKEHPVWPTLEKWASSWAHEHRVTLASDLDMLPGGDLLLLVSCTTIVSRAVRDRYRKCLVCHASDVPKGRGWSPLVWQVLEGKNRICITLMTADDRVDSGSIWAQEWIELEGHELAGEINAKLFAAETRLMDDAIERFNTAELRPQPEVGPSYYRRRTPEDSRISPDSTLAEVFDLLRIADENRYPVFFDHRGHRYALSIRKLGAIETEAKP